MTEERLAELDKDVIDSEKDWIGPQLKEALAEIRRLRSSPVRFRITDDQIECDSPVGIMWEIQDNRTFNPAVAIHHGILATSPRLRTEEDADTD